MPQYVCHRSLAEIIQWDDPLIKEDSTSNTLYFQIVNGFYHQIPPENASST